MAWTGYPSRRIKASTSMPVYRFYNTQKGVHFYTASESEKATVMANLAHTYTYEGVGYHIGQ